MLDFTLYLGFERSRVGQVVTEVPRAVTAYIFKGNVIILSSLAPSFPHAGKGV
jgi:hypothetical protein